MNEQPEQFATKKSLGQHFLNSPLVPEWMCAAAEIAMGDIVVEIGPGTGVLTRALLERGANVIALETDARAIAHLKDGFAEAVASEQLTVIDQDVRELDVRTIPGLTDHGYKVVANIPYYLSGLLFRVFLESPLQPSTLVYLVQKEVAKRITADTSRGEKESLLSLSVKLYGQVTYVRTVSRGHFTPPPNVDSAIVAVQNISRERLAGLAESEFFALLHQAFGQKRKQLVGNLAPTYGRETVTHSLSTLGLPVSVRAEDVPLALWPKLAQQLLSTND